MAIIILLTTVATYFGGWLALRIADKRHLITALGAGTVIGTALFDLLPESMSLLGKDNLLVMGLCAIGFSLYFILNNFLALACKEDGDECKNSLHLSGLFNVGGLCLHSLLDGFAIGLAFQVNTMMGGVVAFAIVAHDLADGMNSVGMVLRSGGCEKLAWKWLSVDAVAPLVGFWLSQCIHLNSNILGILLAIFSGCFLYIGASDLVPECHHDHPKVWTSLFFLSGMFLVWQIVLITR